MALKDMKSLYDRHSKDTLGNSVAGPTGEGPLPSEGAYFAQRGTSDSPFDSVRGPKMDQMVQMLAKGVKSKNTLQKYGPAPGGTENSPFQDLDGVDYGNGRYQNPETGATY